MYILKSVKAILILPVVLVLGIGTVVSILSDYYKSTTYSLPGGLLSDRSTIESLSLEEELAIASSSAGNEIADDTSIADADVVASANTVAIHAINPGYNTDAGSNAGELIEMIKLVDETVSLDGLKIIYTAKPSSSGATGKSTVLYEFPTGAKMVGDVILLRYSGSPEKEADLTYDTTLAMYGSLSLVVNDEMINSVCWLGGADCLPNFSTTVKSRMYTTIVRGETGEYYHTNEPELLYDPAVSGLYLPPENEVGDSQIESGSSSSSANSDPSDSPCNGLIFSEILSYYADEPAEQFIEIQNSSNHEITLGGCAVRYKNKNYSFADFGGANISLVSDSFFVFRPDPVFRLTKNPTTENLLEIVDRNNTVVASLSYPHGQKKSASYALIGVNADGSQEWQTTFHPTPGEPNIPQEFKTCPAGKVINETTGNCVNATKLSSLLKDCGEGKYRNPETGRCKSYNTSDDEKPCKEGYERNPETNRCRKIKDNNGADYPLVPVTGVEENSSFIAFWAIAGIGAIGAIYVLVQFRKEISYFCRQVIGKIRK